MAEAAQFLEQDFKLDTSHLILEQHLTDKRRPTYNLEVSLEEDNGQSRMPGNGSNHGSSRQAHDHYLQR
ncbi:hypothetical protein IV102_19430 [bacterium]|nr:hypothetical protein [bacterium]